MQAHDLTAQVLAQLEYYADRIAYLKNIGDLKSAEVLSTSATAMATAADNQDEWVIVNEA